MTEVTLVNGVKIFGEIEVIAVADQSLESVYEDTIILENELTLTNKSGDQVTLQCHDIFLEHDEEISNKATVKFIVSMDLKESDKFTALLAANMRINKEVIKFYTFTLKEYQDEIINFNVIDFQINFHEVVPIL